MKTRDLSAYGGLALVWGFSFFFLVKSLDAFGWAATASFRCLIAGATLMVLMKLTSRPIAFKGHEKELLIMGLATSALQYPGIAFGAPRIGTAMTAILVSTIPMFSMLISQAQGVERMTTPRFVGLLLGIAGIALLVGFPLVPFSSAFFLGVATCTFGCLSAAYGSVHASRRLSNVDSWTIASVSFFAGGVMLLPLVWFVPLNRAPMLMDFVWLLLLGVLVTGLAYVLYFKLVKAIGPTGAVSVEFVVTVIAVIIGAVLLGERLSLIQLFGAAIVLFGCSLVLGLLPVKLNSSQTPPPAN